MTKKISSISNGFKYSDFEVVTEKIDEIYLGGGKKKSTDMFFILENIKTNCQMDTSEFEGLLYNMLSEEPFANHRLDMTDENEEYTITDYVSQHFLSQ